MKLFPHETLPDLIELHCLSARLLPGGQPLHLQTLETETRIGLSGLPLDETRQQVALDLLTVVPAEAAADYQSQFGEITCVVRAHCPGTGLRTSAVLKPLVQSGSPAGEWQGTLVLDRQQMRGEAEVTAVLAGDQAGDPSRILGVSSVPGPVRLLLDTTEEQGDSYLVDFRWSEFKARSAPPLLRASAGLPFCLDLQSENERPVVWLNDSFPGLRHVLPQWGQPAGAWQAVHEIMQVSICRSVLQTLFCAAADTVRCLASRNSEGTQDAEEPAMPSGWKGDVLGLLLPRLFPGQTASEALGELARLPDLADLLVRAQGVISGNLLEEGAACRRAIQDLQALEDVSSLKGSRA